MKSSSESHHFNRQNLWSWARNERLLLFTSLWKWRPSVSKVIANVDVKSATITTVRMEWDVLILKNWTIGKQMNRKEDWPENTTLRNSTWEVSGFNAYSSNKPRQGQVYLWMTSFITTEEDCWRNCTVVLYEWVSYSSANGSQNMWSFNTVSEQWV